MRNMKVSRKLLVSFAIVIFLSIVITAVGVFGITAVNSNYNNVLTGSNMRFRYIQSVYADMYNIRRVVGLTALFTGNSNMINQYEAEADAIYVEIIGELEAFIATIDTDVNISPETAQLRRYQAEYLEVLVANYFTSTVRPVIAAARAGNQEAATALIYDNIGELENLNNYIADVLAQVQATMDGIGATTTAQSMLYMGVLIGVAILAAIISILLSIYISNMVSRPLAPLTEFFGRAAETGDLQFNQRELEIINKYKNNKDELGILMNAVKVHMDEMNHEMEYLEKISNGDLTVAPNVLSPKDVVGNSLVKVVENLNGMFGEINTAAAQVSSGSQQIADGAQSLAQGSTQQAATVEELSASITEIAEKTRENADLANRAASLAVTIKGNAEKGNQQMSEMVTAVNEISQASQSISKVIKVIDDIAFQTNILALNAAVEAARAGQHGKGFAVVADEVRTLAAKSAEAAKDTGVLISNSMEKAEYGASIAKDTAESLVEIVSGINESTEIIEEIAHASEVQNSGITQINSGIDQVATVVQQNSATAEQSAAAAEELSGQSSMLSDLIAQFKLKGGPAGRHGGGGYHPGGSGGGVPSHGAGGYSGNTGFSLGDSKY